MYIFEPKGMHYVVGFCMIHCLSIESNHIVQLALAEMSVLGNFRINLQIFFCKSGFSALDITGRISVTPIPASLRRGFGSFPTLCRVQPKTIYKQDGAMTQCTTQVCKQFFDLWYS